MNKILFLTNAYPDFDSSHRGIFVKKMASFLQEDGYEISVVTPKIYKGSKFLEDQNGIKIYRFPFFSGNRLLIEYNRIPYLRMIVYYITGFVFTLYTLIKHQCQLIHVHWAIPTGLIGALTGAVLGKPLVVTIHGSDFRLAMGRSLLLKKTFLYVCKKARHLHCVSGDTSAACADARHERADGRRKQPVKEGHAVFSEFPPAGSTAMADRAERARNPRGVLPVGIGKESGPVCLRTGRDQAGMKTVALSRDGADGGVRPYAICLRQVEQ
jgi:glycosyltransferase involved in cell wall biosynthesis